MTLTSSLTSDPSPDLPVSFSPSVVEGNHSHDGLLLGRPLDEPHKAIADKSLLEILDGMVMMYSLSVHQQLGKVRAPPPTASPAQVQPSSPPVASSRWWWFQTTSTSTPWP